VVTLTVTDNNGNVSTATANVTVEDKIKPTVITQPVTLYLNINGVASVTAAQVNNGSTDNCSIANYVLDKTNFTCSNVGANTVYLTVTDVNGNFDTKSAIITVVDNIPPTITCPPNITHLNDPGVCSYTVNIINPLTSDNCGIQGVVGTRSDALALTAPYPVGMTTINWVVTDLHGNTNSCVQSIEVTNTLPIIGTVTGPATPMPLGSNISIVVSNNDNNLANAAIVWDDATPSTIQNVPNPASGSFSVSHTYTAAGVYSILVTLTDACGMISGTYKYDYVVIYDPNGGFVTGGGWINSPAGAYVANPTLTGKANFGFVAKYKKGSTIPDGNTEFQFQAGNLNFNSSSYDDMRLVISGYKANYKGVGKINGTGSYGFLVSAIDGNVKNGGGIDKFRIKIWNKNSGNAIVYDNNMGLDENDLPTTALGGGSIVIHENGKSGESGDPIIGDPVLIEGLTALSVYPNPTSGPATFKFILKESSNATITILSSTGQVVQKAWEGYVKGGEFKYVEMDNKLANGLYFIQLRTGNEIKTARLIITTTY
jgi:hypothetical protein